MYAKKYKTDDMKRKALNIKRKFAVLLNIRSFSKNVQVKRKNEEKILPAII